MDLGAATSHIVYCAPLSTGVRGIGAPELRLRFKLKTHVLKKCHQPSRGLSREADFP